MAARRPASFCLFCQARQSSIGRRRLTRTARRKLDTAALRPVEDGFFLGNEEKRRQNLKRSDPRGKGLPEVWKVPGQNEELSDTVLGFEAWWKMKESRIAVLRTLSNPWPPVPGRRPSKPMSKDELMLPEANAALIPHAIFRRKLKEASSGKPMRQIIRAQLLRCERPREIVKVIAVAMQNKVSAYNLSILCEPLMRALYRCRAHVSDPEVLSLLNSIITRFRMAGLAVAPELFLMGLKFAARARSLAGMKRYLKDIREGNMAISSGVFRSVIAKCSIGHRGLGEIRNGRWRRDQLTQVLKGFEDARHLPREQQYHLETFMNRDDWQYLHGWVAVLGRCKDGEGVWREWDRWKESPSRVQPKALQSQKLGMTSKVRGDYWFLEQMTYSGDYEKAWKMLKETGLPFHSLKDRVKTKLLDGIEHATMWNDDVRKAVLRKYDTDLARIESALGVKWVAGTGDGEGHHTLVEDREEALDRLGADDWKPEEDYGFPLDESIVGSRTERQLHDAEESGLACASKPNCEE